MASKPQCAMWLDLEQKSLPDINSDFSLHPVDNKDRWDVLLKLRIEIEKEFGILEEKRALEMIDEIREVVHNFKAQWFIAYSKGIPVGSVGMVKFAENDLCYGRLLDVDIVPSAQGEGLGNQLIFAIVKEAKKVGIAALCLKTDADSWVKHWYARLGFEKTGNWVPLRG